MLENAQWGQIEAALQQESALQRHQDARLTRLEALVRLSRLTASSRDTTQVLTAICHVATTLLHVPYVTIWVADEAARMLTVPVCSNAEIAHSMPRATMPFGQGTLGWVAQYRQALHIPDVFADDRVQTLDWWRAHGFRSRFAAPILHQETLLGVLGMAGYAPFCFAPDDRWCLEQLLSHAMVAIRDAVLYQTLQQSEACYRFILEQQTDMICRFRPDTTLTFVNDAYCRYFGKLRQALIGQSFLRLIPPQARAAAQDHIASLICTRAP